MILEVSLGANVALTSDQSDLFHLEERSDHGIALRKFADDREQGRAVAQAMISYALGKDALEKENSNLRRLQQ